MPSSLAEPSERPSTPTSGRSRAGRGAEARIWGWGRAERLWVGEERGPRRETVSSTLPSSSLSRATASLALASSEAAPVEEAAARYWDWRAWTAARAASDSCAEEGVRGGEGDEGGRGSEGIRWVGVVRRGGGEVRVVGRRTRLEGAERWRKLRWTRRRGQKIEDNGEEGNGRPHAPDAPAGSPLSPPSPLAAPPRAARAWHVYPPSGEPYLPSRLHAPDPLAIQTLPTCQGRPREAPTPELAATSR